MSEDGARPDAAVPAGAAEFMGRNGRTFMITLRADGSPTAHPMAGFYGGALYLNTYRKSAKARNLGRDDRICCVVTNSSDAPRFEGAVYRGRARLLPGDEVFAPEVPPGLAWARNPRSGGSQDQPEVPPEDERRIGETAGRIRRGVRVVYEVRAEEAGMLAEIRDGD